MNITESKENAQTLKPQPSISRIQFIPGIWTSGRYYWLQNSLEKVIPKEGLVVKVKQEQIHSKIRFNSVYVSNLSDQIKEVKVLAMHQNFYGFEEQLTFISPAENKIFHYMNKHVFLVNGKYNTDTLKECTAVPQWSAFTDQVFSSLHKGTLKYQPMVKGLGSSIFTMEMTIKPHETCKMNAWVIMGTDKNEVISMERALLKNRLAFPSE